MFDPRIRKWLAQIREGRWDTTQVNKLWVPKRETIRRLPWRPVVVAGTLMLGSPIVASAFYDVEGKEWPHPHRLDRALLLKQIGDERENTWRFDFIALSTIAILTASGSTPPSDISSNPQVDCIAPGANGSAGTNNSGTSPGEAGGPGGGGGAFASATLSGVTTSTSYQVGAANSGNDTWFKSALDVNADAPAAGSSTGGIIANCVGTTKRKGGDGGAGGIVDGGANNGAGGGGGGGAAANAADGVNGTLGASNTTGGVGGAGGASGDGAAGGTGGPVNSGTGGTGTAGSGYALTAGGTAGPGGGGGGGGCGNVNAAGRAGGAGGNYGSGGGGGGGAGANGFGAGGAAGVAKQGAILLNYTAAGAVLLGQVWM